MQTLNGKRILTSTSGTEKIRAGKLLEGSRPALFFLDFARAFCLSKSEVGPKVGPEDKERRRFFTNQRLFYVERAMGIEQLFLFIAVAKTRCFY